MQQLFMTPSDICNPWGKLEFKANSLEFLGNIAADEPILRTFTPDPSKPLDPSWTDYWMNQEGLRVSLAYQAKDGLYVFYCVRVTQRELDPASPTFYQGSFRHWQIYRATSQDGYTIQDLRLVFAGPERPPHPYARWANHWMARNARTGMLYFYIMGREETWGGLLGLFVFGSLDGDTWHLLSDQPGYLLNHDTVSLLWDGAKEQVISYQIFNFQDEHKTIIDNTKNRRRAISILTSPDALHFQEQLRITPDLADPPDMEFYRMSGFVYGDRYLAMVNEYAPSPLRPNRHAPHLMCEWWVSADGVHWQRPWRDVEAQGGAPYTIEADPIFVDNAMLWWINEQIWGLPAYRIASVGSKSNAAFTTLKFTMPPNPLLLNAAIPTRPRFFNQSYVMAELLDEHWRLLPGYEREKCLIQEKDATDLPLLWEGKGGVEFAGHQVSIRFYLRDARIYAIQDRSPE